MLDTSNPSAPPTVLVDDQALATFLAAAVIEYSRLTPDSPLPCFALLAGEVQPDVIRVERAVFTANARATDPSALQEFAETIVPAYGPAYRNAVRGWWASPQDVLRASRQAEADGLDLLGSIHMHPDWHRIGPPHERSTVLSERPTEMDRYVFTSTAWPVNLICYLEQREGGLYHSLGAWGTAVGEDGDTCHPLPLRMGTRPFPLPLDRAGSLV
jgi:hypothetical protein